MATPWRTDRALSLPALLAQALVLGSIMLVARLVLTDGAKDALLYSGLFAAVWLLLGLALQWSRRDT